MVYLLDEEEIAAGQILKVRTSRGTFFAVYRSVQSVGLKSQEIRELMGSLS